MKWSWFVGVREGKGPLVFADMGMPTKIRYPQFRYIVGPFQSETNAIMYATESARELREKNPGARWQRRNPGTEWHISEREKASTEALRHKGSKRTYYIGKADAHQESANESRLRGINPRRNPPTVIYEDIEAIDAQKGKDSLWPKEKFRHEFKKGARVLGLANGDLLIKSKKGKKLWKEFDY